MKIGDKILVVSDLDSGVFRSYVLVIAGGRITCSTDPPSRGQPFTGVISVVSRHDRGITWARGWDTKEANALRSSAALSR